MSLESNQFQHDGLQVAKNNLSGSNDPHQLQHDLTEQILKGARRDLALKELGLDDADYFALAASEHRYSPDQEGRIERVMGESSPRIKNAQRRIVQKAQYEQRGARNAAEVSGLPAELGLDQYFREDSPEFGNDQSALQNITQQELFSDSVGDVATRRAVQGTDVNDPNSVIISEYKRRPGIRGYLQPKERVQTQVTLGATQPTPAALQEAFKTRDFGLFQDDVVQRTAPDAQRALKAADRAEGLSVVAGERQKRSGESRKRLENEVAYRTAAGRGSIISDAAFSDAAMAELQSDARTAALLEEVFGNQVSALPGKPVGSEIMPDARLVPTPGTTSETQYTYVDPRDGHRIALAEPPVYERSNTPNTYQALNAPVDPPSVGDWVAGRRPEFTLNPDAGFAYPQTNLTGTNQRVIQAINAYGQKNNIDPFQPAGSMISMGEMQNVVDFVNAREASPDGMIYRTQNGQRLPVQPGTGTALTALGLNAREQQELAQMMIQMTAAKTSGIDTEAKRRYYTGDGKYKNTGAGIEREVNIRSTAGGPKVSSPTRAAAIASVGDKGNAGKVRRLIRDLQGPGFDPMTSENAQGVAYGSPAGEVYRDYGYARPDQADAFMVGPKMLSDDPGFGRYAREGVDRNLLMAEIPERAYESMNKTRRDVVNLQELDSARAQQARSIQQERQEPPREPNLPALGPMVRGSQEAVQDSELSRRISNIRRDRMRRGF